MPSVAVRILHAEPRPAAGALERWLGATRARLAAEHVRGFRAAGADDVRLMAGPADDTPFGARLREIVAGLPGGSGLVIAGSGAIPLATLMDRRSFVRIAASGERRALANNRYSADVVAVGRASDLAALPDLPADNALPRWLAETAGYEVADLTRRWRLAPDLDSPLDTILLRGRVGGAIGREVPAGIDLGPALRRRAAIARVAADRWAELLVAGRTSAGSLRWLERNTACRVRALVEERGLRASSRLALAGGGESGSRASGGRPPRSVLAMVLERDGPGALGARLAELADAALVDTRVLLAHRLGPDEAAWPPAEDRFASDLLLPERVTDPWLRELTAAARSAPIPVLLGGHTLVGPGVQLVVSAAADTADAR